MVVIFLSVDKFRTFRFLIMSLLPAVGTYPVVEPFYQKMKIIVGGFLEPLEYKTEISFIIWADKINLPRNEISKVSRLLAWTSLIIKQTFAACAFPWQTWQNLAASRDDILKAISFRGSLYFKRPRSLLAELKVFLNTDLLFGVSTCCRRVTSEYSATSSLLIRKQLKAADIGRLDRCERKEGKLDFLIQLRITQVTSRA